MEREIFTAIISAAKPVEAVSCLVLSSQSTEFYICRDIQLSFVVIVFSVVDTVSPVSGLHYS